MSSVPALLILLGWSFGFVSPTFITQPRDLVYGLYELTDAIITITDIACTDPDRNPNPDFVVSVDSISGNCPKCFQVYPSINCGTGADFCLRYLPLQQLNYDITNVYRVLVRCTERGNDSNTNTELVEIRLIPNTPPIFTTLPSVTTSVSLTKNVKAGDSIYTVRCSDPNGDALEFTLNTYPPTSLFYIDTEGVIRAAADLNAACFTSVTFEVTCSDRRHDPVDPVYVFVDLNGANEQPVVTGLNFNLDIPEDEAVGSILSLFTVTDDDAVSCQITTSPLDSLQYFELDPFTNTVKVFRTLDYEQYATRNTNITVTCFDGFCTSTTAYLYVRVTEVNEPITLVPGFLRLSVYEGVISVDPQWTPIDPDADDDPIYTIISGNGNGYFTINPFTGIITSTIEYDVDQNAMSAFDSMVVQVTDEAGHPSTATVSVTVLDINDNRPTFTTGSQTIFTEICLSQIGATIGNAVTSYDRDSILDGNNVIYYRTTPIEGPITVDDNGNIRVTGQVTVGSTYTMEVYAIDSGSGPNGALTSLPAFVTVIVTDCVTTTAPPPTTTAAPPTAGPTTAAPTTTATPRNSKDKLEENLAWIIFAALVAMVFLAALAFMLWRYCYPAGMFGAGGGGGRFTAFCNNACRDCCTPRAAPKTVQPYRGHPPRGGNRGFWQERYPDDDYNKPPERDRTPSPAPMEGGGPLALQPASNWRPRQPAELF